MFETRRDLTVFGRLASLNWLSIALIVILSGVGVGTLYAVAGGSFDPWAQRHAVRCLLGLGLIVGCAFVPVRVWSALAVPGYLVALAMLAAVPVFGTEAMGARRWLNIGGLSLQPSEIMKVALVLVLAWYYAWLPPRDISKPVWVALPAVLIALPVVLTLRQPDLGTAILFAGLGLGVLYLAGVSTWYFLVSALIVVLTAPSALSRLHEYQRRRLDVFLDPGADPLGAGYHITQAKIALAAGGLHGQGYLKGTQNQLDFVPEKMTDFVFVSIGEEWGLVGACVVLALFSSLILTLLRLSVRHPQPFGRLVIVGAMLSLSIYVGINIAMVSGLVPVVGVPLPLISYGGSSLISMMIALGLALSVDAQAVRGARHESRFSRRLSGSA